MWALIKLGLFLAFSGAVAIAMPATDQSCFREFNETILSVLVRQRVATTWPQNLPFSSAHVSSTLRATAIVDIIFDDGSVRSRMHDHLGNLIQDYRLMEKYMWNVFDRVTTYSDSYRQSMRIADRELPPEGILIDYGGGAGFLSAYLKHRKSGRMPRVVDRNWPGLELAHEKLIHVAFGKLDPLWTDHRVLQNYPLSLRGTARGGVMSRVIQQIPKAHRVSVLKASRSDLMRGAKLILTSWIRANDTLEARRKRLHYEATSAVENASPMTEQDLALHAFQIVNCSGSVCQTHPSLPELTQLVNDSGYEILYIEMDALETSATLVLENPI
jgi:hypothetical protein